MKIILTVNNFQLLKNPKSLAQELSNYDIDFFRFNLSKIVDYDEYFRCIEILQEKCQKELIFDVPIPGRKLRLYFKDVDNNVKEIHRNECYKLVLTNNTSKHTNELSIFGTDDLSILKSFIGEKIVVGDNEGCFELLLKNNNYSLKAIDSFNLINGKAIHINEINLIPKNLSLKILSYIKKIRPKGIMLSFVEHPEQVLDVKSFLKDSNIKVFSKIESNKGIENIEEICQASDILVVARGDLPIYTLPQKLFFYQNKIIDISKMKNKQTYIATDVLWSLKYRSSPSRSDIIDLTYAINNGIDGIILSAGQYDVNLAIKLIREIYEICKKQS